MSEEPKHPDHDHDHAPAAPDAGSQALSEALRSSFAVVKIVMVLMVIAFFGSGFFQVRPSEKAIILRFGKPVGEGQKALLTSGLHWSFPYPIDEVVKIPISEVQKITSNNGWYFTTQAQEDSGEELPSGASLNPAVDGYVLTADDNIIHSRVTLSYHIDNPIDYIFNFVSASNSVQDALDSAVLYTAAHYNVDGAIYNLQGFGEAVQERVGELIDTGKFGIVIDSCQADNRPPRQLTDVFSQVTIARENSSKVIYDANNYANTNLLSASSIAFGITNKADSDRVMYVGSMDALTNVFNVQLVQYQANPQLFMQQQLGDKLAAALTNAQRVAFLPERLDGKTRELRLMLSDPPPEQKPATGP
jgi:membrane protease subunit HflK